MAGEKTIQEIRDIFERAVESKVIEAGVKAHAAGDAFDVDLDFHAHTGAWRIAERVASAIVSDSDSGWVEVTSWCAWELSDCEGIRKGEDGKFYDDEVERGARPLTKAEVTETIEAVVEGWVEEQQKDHDIEIAGFDLERELSKRIAIEA